MSRFERHRADQPGEGKLYSIHDTKTGYYFGPIYSDQAAVDADIAALEAGRRDVWPAADIGWLDDEGHVMHRVMRKL